jgi:hypothetical protein
MDIDIPGFELWEAIEEILFKLEECRIKGIQEILIIHGYQHGQRLKSYIQSEGFIKEMAREGFIYLQKSNNKYYRRVSNGLCNL